MTLKELRGLDHDIFVYFRDELCRVAVESGDVYLLSNNCDYDGTCPYEMHGYEYSWWLCSAKSCDELKLHRYLKPAKRRPL